MTHKKDIWTNVVTGLESHMPRSELTTWFCGADLKELQEDSAVIEVPNKFVANWLKDNYLTRIQNSFKDNLGFMPKIRLIYTTPTSPQETAPYERAKNQEPLSDSGLDPKYTFSNFVTAKSNRFAYSTSLRVAYGGLNNYNPLFIFSRLSSGKSHLLNAIGNHILAKNRSLMVRYLSIERFSKDLSLAKKYKKIDEFKKSYKNLDFLLVDDIHLLDGRKKTQEQLLTVFNSLYQSKRQIVFASKMPPSNIPNLLPQLRSRLEWGLLSEIDAPDHETKVNIIKQNVEQENLELQDDVIFFLAKATNNLKTLIRYLVSVETYTSLYNRQIDISALESIIGNRAVHDISPYEIQKMTAHHFNLSISDLLSNKKKHTFSYPRHLAMYLTRKLTHLSYKQIGKTFGNKDHSTVIYAVNRIRKYTKDRRNPVLDDIKRIEASFS